MDMVTTQRLNEQVAADMTTAVTGALIGAQVRLFQNDIVPAPSIPIGDYTVATYDGYADEAVTWLAPSLADDGTIEIIGTVGEFRPTGSVVGNIVYGFLLLDGTGALIQAGRFDNAPISMGSTLDSLLITPRVRVPIAGRANIVS